MKSMVRGVRAAAGFQQWIRRIKSAQIGADLSNILRRNKSAAKSAGPCEHTLNGAGKKYNLGQVHPVCVSSVPLFCSRSRGTELNRTLLPSANENQWNPLTIMGSVSFCHTVRQFYGKMSGK